MTRPAASVFLSLLSFTTLLGACSDDGAGLAVDAPVAQPDASPGPDATPVVHPGCTLWLSDVDGLRPTGATVEARGHDGVLELASGGDGQGSCSSNREPCYAVKLYKPTAFTGDFDVSIEVASVDSASVLGGVRLYVIGGNTLSSPRVEVALLGRAGAAHLVIDHQGPGGSGSQSLLVDTAGGTLRLRRAGNDVTATATSGTDQIEQPFGWSSDGEIGIALDEGDTATRTSARITSYTALGSNAETDAFDCTADLLQ